MTTVVGLAWLVYLSTWFVFTLIDVARASMRRVGRRL